MWAVHVILYCLEYLDRNVKLLTAQGQKKLVAESEGKHTLVVELFIVSSCSGTAVHGRSGTDDRGVERPAVGQSRRSGGF